MNKFKQIRERLDLSQEELAKLLGVKVHSIIEWEKSITPKRAISFLAFKLNLSEEDIK